MAGLFNSLQRLLSDRAFLKTIHGFERLLAKLLTVLLALVILAATFQLTIWLVNALIDPASDWFRIDLVLMLDRLLMILIALEVLQNLTAYLREHVVQIELVLVTGLTALARKVIVLPPGMEKDPADLIGLAAAVVGLALAYWLVRQAHDHRDPPRRGPARRFRGLDRWPPPDDAARP
ncbi:MAG: phosphate-starvation-inducible PsiE family protein [Prochlorococcaceae cyanobacterium]